MTNGKENNMKKGGDDITAIATVASHSNSNSHQDGNSSIVSRQVLRQREHRFLATTSSSLGLTAVGILIFFLIWEPTDESNSVRLPAASLATNNITKVPDPNNSNTNEFNLPLATWETIKNDPASPQTQAYEWLLDDVIANQNNPSWEASTSTAVSRNSNATTNANTADADADAEEFWRQHQRYALAVLYYATNGDNWIVNQNNRNNHYWLDHTKDECEWHSTANNKDILCHTGNDHKLQGKYKALYLNGMGLEGSIPPEVYTLLPSLQTMDLSHNLLFLDRKDTTTATLIATEIGHLSQLETLNLAHIPAGGMTGSLPTELGRLTSLKTLELQDTPFSLAVPSELGFLSRSLQLLNISQSKLTGTIPTQLCESLNESQLVFDCSSRLCGCDRCDECAALPPTTLVLQLDPQESTTIMAAMNATTTGEESEESDQTNTINDNEILVHEAGDTETPPSVPPPPPPPGNLEIVCSFRSLATAAGLVMCENVCELAEQCWKEDAPVTTTAISDECSRYSSSCVNLNAKGKQEQIEAACAESQPDPTDCIILCADAPASCKNTPRRRVECGDYEACHN